MPKNFDGWSYEAIMAYKAAINLKRRLKRQQKLIMREYWYGKEESKKPLKNLKTTRIRSPKLKDTPNRIISKKERDAAMRLRKRVKWTQADETKRSIEFIKKLQLRMQNRLDKKKQK